MINLLDEAQRLLNGSEIATTYVDIAPDRKALAFESATVLGFVLGYPDATTLLLRWRADDSALISQNQLSLRRAQAKAWNAYTICLAADAASYGDLVALNAIEEDLAGTRKIARSGISDIEQLRAALLPLLPIQHAPSLDSVDMPSEIRLRTTELPLHAVEAFLSEAQEPVLIQVLEEEP